MPLVLSHLVSTTTHHQIVIKSQQSTSNDSLRSSLQVFRMIDRADYMIFGEDDEDERLEAYEDHAWRRGTLHLSAPCIYTKALEALRLNEGMYMYSRLSILYAGHLSGVYCVSMDKLLYCVLLYCSLLVPKHSILLPPAPVTLSS